MGAFPVREMGLYVRIKVEDVKGKIEDNTCSLMSSVTLAIAI